MPATNDIVSETVDIQVENHGTLFLFRPLTDTARDWFTEHLPEDAPMFGSAYAVEHRYAYDIAEGALADGLACSYAAIPTTTGSETP